MDQALDEQYLKHYPQIKKENMLRAAQSISLCLGIWIAGMYVFSFIAMGVLFGILGVPRELSCG